MNKLHLLITSCVLSLVCGVGCVWNEATHPGKQTAKIESISTSTMFNMSINPTGIRQVDKIEPDELNWTKTCREVAKKIDPCLRAWTDDELKNKRHQPITAEVYDIRFTSYFEVRDEEESVIDPDSILGHAFSTKEIQRRLELYDRRIWIEQADLAALAQEQVPKHAWPADHFSSGIIPRGGRPSLMFRVGMSHDAECVRRKGVNRFNLAEIREHGHVGRITGRFVAWNPDESFLQKISYMTQAMVLDTAWHQMELSWHKQNGSTMWWSDSIIMLSTYDKTTGTASLTFRRSNDNYNPAQVDFKNRHQTPMRLGDWLLNDNVAPYHLQTVFPKSTNSQFAKWTIPTIAPRIPSQTGAIFIPDSVEILAPVHNRETDEVHTMSFGCIPFETKGLHGAIRQQIARQILPQQGEKHEKITLRFADRHEPFGNLFNSNRSR
jgi:hypothetical protein